MPTQTLDIISVNLWQMIVSLANLVLLFLIVKKFLYKPVKKTLESRQRAIEEDYDEARRAKEQALADKTAYEAQLSSAKAQADAVIQDAVDLARAREREIVEQAKARADGIVRQAQDEVMLERKKAEDSIKQEIVVVSSMLTEKVLEREVSSRDHQRLIDSFIESMGDGDAAN